MSTTIKDGTGSGNTTKVNSEGRLFTNSAIIEDDSLKAQEGEAFLNASQQTLTSANESALIYIENTGTRDIIITRIAFISNFSTGGAATELIGVTIFMNSTGGTIVSDAVNATSSNRNLGSNNELTANIYAGGEGKTITGGTKLLPGARISAPGIGALTSSLILPKGSNLAVTMTPTTGNTSVVVSVAIDTHLNGFNV